MTKGTESQDDLGGLGGGSGGSLRVYIQQLWINDCRRKCYVPLGKYFVVCFAQYILRIMCNVYRGCTSESSIGCSVGGSDPLLEEGGGDGSDDVAATRVSTGVE